MDKATFIARYGEAVERRRATVLVGAGLSFDGGYPSWSALLGELRDNLGLDDEFEDLPQLAQYVENQKDGRATLIRAVCVAIGSVTPHAAENHRLLAQLPLEEVWTTNFDPLVEMGSAGEDVVVHLDDELVEANGSMRCVHKMHGSILPGASEPVGGIDRLVISRDDFDNYERDHPRFWRLLQAQFLTQSFLFLGFSLSDPNLEALIRIVRQNTPDRPVSHYAVLQRTADDGPEFDLRAGDLARAGVHIIEIAEFDEITDLLRRLVARTRPSRLFVSGSEPRSTAPAALVPGDVYPSVSALPDDLLALARLLGQRLARTGIRVATANLLGAEVGYALLDELGNDYDPGRMMLIRRTNQEPMSPPNIRRGQVVFIGDDPAGMRAKIYVQTRAVVVLRGGVGTRTEVDDSRAEGLGVVPIAHTGGAALEVWSEMEADLDDYELGGRPIPRDLFLHLNDRDPGAVVEATVKLITQAMYLPDDPGR